MAITEVRVRTASRLHFGMLSFGNPNRRQFGGAGVMIDAPGIELILRPSDADQVRGLLAGRVKEEADRILATNWIRERRAYCAEITSTARWHTGFGTGTQLAFAVGLGLSIFHEIPLRTLDEYATILQRARRGAIGTYGFFRGGLLVDGGKSEEGQLSPLITHVNLPESWRFVTLTPKMGEGLSGEREKKAFADGLPPVPEETTRLMCQELVQHLLPSAVDGDFLDFSESLYRYGFAAGMCYASIQGGPFRTRDIESLVGRIRGFGISGVGQSSWGPTVFAVLPTNEAAQDFLERVRESHLTESHDIVVTQAARSGAEIRTQDEFGKQAHFTVTLSGTQILLNEVA